jgi:hypothetical protein
MNKNIIIIHERTSTCTNYIHEQKYGILMNKRIKKNIHQHTVSHII